MAWVAAQRVSMKASDNKGETQLLFHHVVSSNCSRPCLHCVHNWVAQRDAITPRDSHRHLTFFCPCPCAQQVHSTHSLNTGLPRQQSILQFTEEHCGIGRYARLRDYKVSSRKLVGVSMHLPLAALSGWQGFCKLTRWMKHMEACVSTSPQKTAPKCHF